MEWVGGVIHDHWHLCQHLSHCNHLYCVRFSPQDWAGLSNDLISMLVSFTESPSTQQHKSSQYHRLIWRFQQAALHFKEPHPPQDIENRLWTFSIACPRSCPIPTLSGVTTMLQVYEHSLPWGPWSLVLEQCRSFSNELGPSAVSGVDTIKACCFFRDAEICSSHSTPLSLSPLKIALL